MEKLCTSFRKYVTSNYGEKLKSDAINTLKSMLSERTGVALDKIEASNLKSNWVETLGISDYIYFKLKWSCDVPIFHSRHEFFCSYRVSLTTSTFTIEPFELTEPTNCVVLDEFLVPEIEYTNDNLDLIANEILCEVYNNEVPSSGKICAYTFAEKLQLQILSCEVKNWNENIMGAIVFSPTDFVIREDMLTPYHAKTIESGTILLNSRASYERGVGSVNNTIIHECIHWLLHWRLAYFYRMQNGHDGRSFVCSSIEDLDNAQVLKVAEKQANSLAPRILMPKDAFMEKTNSQFNGYVFARNEVGQYKESYNYLNVDIVDKYLIKALADYFEVSELSAKIRLIETDFTLARGTRIYVDGSYVRPYSFYSESLSPYETYTISTEDFNLLLAKSEPFRNQLETGAYLFVENHVVLADPLAVTCAGSKLILTEYAREHLNIYALKFSVKRKGLVDTDCVAEVCCLWRLPTFSVQESLAFLPSSNADIMKNAETKKKEWIDFYYKQPRAWNLAIKGIMKEQGFSIKQVATDCGLEYDTLQKNLTADKDHHISKRTFTLICFKIVIPYCVSKMLITDIGFLNFDERDPEDRCYLQILTGYIGATWADCNEYLISCGIEPFTSERKPIKANRMDIKNPKTLLDYRGARGY